MTVLSISHLYLLMEHKHHHQLKHNPAFAVGLLIFVHFGENYIFTANTHGHFYVNCHLSEMSFQLKSILYKYPKL